MRKVMYRLSSVIAVVMLMAFSTPVVHAKCLEARTINPDDFDDPQDNLYWPMAVGHTYHYEAEEEDGLIINEITNTGASKVILGVTCTVIYDVEWIDVEGVGLVTTEETYDWYAWDNDGNVWYFGEWTTEFEYDEDWNQTGENHEGSWEAGVNDALPGIVMLADPVPGVCYQQEYYEGEAEDMGKVLRLGVSVSVEYGDFDNCLVTKEWTPLDPGAVEHKYYAPGVGLVLIEELKEKTVKVELIDIE
jgi:hypothetical protein